jgi:archaellum biogenesis ATPase FlaH
LGADVVEQSLACSALFNETCSTSAHQKAFSFLGVHMQRYSDLGAIRRDRDESTPPPKLTKDQFLALFDDHKLTESHITDDHEQYSACCPAHSDRTPSLSIGIDIGEQEDVAVLKCQREPGCDVSEICAALDIQMSQLWLKKDPADAKPVFTRMGIRIRDYIYQWEDGTEAVRSVRFDPKAFRQMHIVNGTEIWTGIKNPPLYHLPQLKKALDAKQDIYIVEGEKDVESLERLRLAATTNIGGACHNLDSFKALEGAERVYVIPDQDIDGPGQRHGALVVNMLLGKVKNLFQITLPDCKDVTEYLEKHSPDELKAVFSAAQPVSQEVPIPDPDHFTVGGKRYKPDRFRELFQITTPSDFAIFMENFKKAHHNHDIEVYDRKEDEYIPKRSLLEIMKKYVLQDGEYSYQLAIERWWEVEPTYRKIVNEELVTGPLVKNGLSYWNECGERASKSYSFMTKVQAIAAYDEVLNAAFKKVSSGNPGLDKMLGGGFIIKNLYILVAATSAFKSAFLQNFAVLQAKAGIRVLFITTEMDRSFALDRLVTIGYDDSQKGSLFKMQASKTNFLENIHIEDIGSSYSSENLKRMFDKSRFDIILADYMDDLKPSKTSDQSWIEAEQVGKDLESFAKDFGLPLITATQSNLSTEDTDGDAKEYIGLSDMGHAKYKAVKAAAVFGVARYRSLDPDYAKVYFKKPHRYGGDQDSQWYMKSPNSMKLTEIAHPPFQDPGAVQRKKGLQSTSKTSQAVRNAINSKGDFET